MGWKGGEGETPCSMGIDRILEAMILGGGDRRGGGGGEWVG